MSAEEAVVSVRLPRWIVEEAHKRGLGEDAIARAAVKLALLEEILSQHGLDEEDLTMDPEKEKRREAVVLDTNIILASILKQGSYTSQVIIYITDILGIETYTPEKTLQEIEEHLEELATF
ncbi:MAG: hypothetical protein F7B20_00660 [Aeropyrum sp.]|nr:hypothetical protein [Aeropyrum sp.]